ncbi:hypothetical protein ACEYW6_04845 [Nostoc sp. UIC 10607]|jgi:uncharacterized protein YfaP (DUF2135 family)|uniref:Arc-like DNA binding domain-containing protein n=2 Tax=Nostoc TaxID=1177 RepID=A0ABR8I7I0_9NOSO|nr:MULTISPECIES: hypothetical protein [Nostoc]MBD2561300.1 hypothetical protein [Nostoc linckia FACHB-391]MBD2646440.1 hypothetical protein [Nostoc foliaceum FACHB-393]MBG1241491.1 hypothetical protein [Nostoc sp. NZL]MBW4425863.1 hypothetical protein [Nostoc desertorum CM1-VF14]
MNMVQSNQLEIRHISPKVRQLIQMYADVNNCTQPEMLERIVLEWNAQQSESERPPGDEDE